MFTGLRMSAVAASLLAPVLSFALQAESVVEFRCQMDIDGTPRTQQVTLGVQMLDGNKGNIVSSNQVIGGAIRRADGSWLLQLNSDANTWDTIELSLLTGTIGGDRGVGEPQDFVGTRTVRNMDAGPEQVSSVLCTSNILR